MNSNDRVEEIRKRLAENAYFLNPHSDVNVREDIAYLLKLIEDLTKKNKILSDHAADLTQEIENVRSDFGNQR